MGERSERGEETEHGCDAGVTTRVNCIRARSERGELTGAGCGCDACVTTGVNCAKEALLPLLCSTSRVCLARRLVDSFLLSSPPCHLSPDSHHPPTCAAASLAASTSPGSIPLTIPPTPSTAPQLLHTTHLLVPQPPLQPLQARSAAPPHPMGAARSLTSGSRRSAAADAPYDRRTGDGATGPHR